jgi:hypothetical protein
VAKYASQSIQFKMEVCVSGISIEPPATKAPTTIYQLHNDLHCIKSRILWFLAGNTTKMVLISTAGLVIL